MSGSLQVAHCDHQSSRSKGQAFNMLSHALNLLMEQVYIFCVLLKQTVTQGADWYSK